MPMAPHDYSLMFQGKGSVLTCGAVEARWAGVHAVAGGVFRAVVTSSTRETCSLLGEVVVCSCQAGKWKAGPFWTEVAQRARASFLPDAWEE